MIYAIGTTYTPTHPHDRTEYRILTGYDTPEGRSLIADENDECYLDLDAAVFEMNRRAATDPHAEIDLTEYVHNA